MEIPRRSGMRRAGVPRRLRRFLQDPATLLGLTIVVITVSVAIGAPFLAPHDPTDVDLENSLSPPNREFPLGADHLGRDELSRLIYGARTTLWTAGIVLSAVFAVALAVGTVSGYYGGWLDTILMGLVDLLLAFPGLILAVAIAGTLGPSLTNVMIAMAVVWWAGHARLIRALVLSVRRREYIEAAIALGSTNARIMVVHVWRNILGPVVVLATLDMGLIVLGISALNFLGLGAQPPTPEWGAMLNDGRPFLQTDPRLIIFPGAAICLVVLGFNLLGAGLRDILDPTFYRR